MTSEEIGISEGQKLATGAAAQGDDGWTLLEAMTGRASTAKAAVGDGWCFSCGGFAGHVKLMFVNGAALEPVPPVGMGKSTRGVELESVNDLDERQVAAWMTQVTAVPGVGGKKR